MLQRAGDVPRESEALMRAWQSWNPAAGFFHFSTKDARYVSKAAADRLVRERAAARPAPGAAPPRHRRERRIPLPDNRDVGDFERVLRRRRTWRRFGRGPVTRADLATLLRLTFAAQHWVDLGAAGRVMLRTSPSAGARHPLEAYVMARRVSGVPNGIYHYDASERELRRVRRPLSRFDLYLPGQPWYRGAALLVLITAVFERTEWKYPFPRAYRTILLEAGHFVQTFCLTATALDLAPFCTAALADSAIERALKVDGVTESVVYACGVGRRPPGVEWAPWPGTTKVPRLIGANRAPRRRSR